MNVYTTFSDKSQYKLKPIEKIVWFAIQGMLNEQYAYNVLSPDSIQILIKPSDVFSETLTTYKVSPSYPGLLEDVRTLFGSFIPTMQKVQGSYNQITKETVIIIQHFELKLEHYSGLNMR